MVAAPQRGTLTIVYDNVPQNGALRGTGDSVDVYLSDVVGAEANLDSGSGAGTASQTFWTPKGYCTIVDFSVATGLTDTTAGRLTVGGRPMSNMIRWANHINTLQNRAPLMLKLAPGARLGIVQLA
jgi:hypothetical protein